MENKECNCSECEHWEECEIGLIVHNPLSLVEYQDRPIFKSRFTINKGDKVAQCTLKEHKGYLMGYESDVVRCGGFGSTGK